MIFSLFFNEQCLGLHIECSCPTSKIDSYNWYLDYKTISRNAKINRNGFLTMIYKDKVIIKNFKIILTIIMLNDILNIMLYDKEMLTFWLKTRTSFQTMNL